jgi:MarR family transcriptional regulator, lower aerobic nicotinate degradation pathway regulator
MSPTSSHAKKKETGNAYVLDEQIGFLLRQATQRHLAIFSEHMVESLTPTQFSALLRLYQLGPCSQNLLGRRSAMDAATIKGVIDRLAQRGLTENKSDKRDGRLMVIHLTAKGRALVSDALIAAERITAKTLKPLNVREQTALLRLLKKLC